MANANKILAKRLKQRAKYGKEKYGKALKPWDGRNTVKDAVEEALDLAVYLTKLEEERQEVAALLWRAAKHSDPSLVTEYWPYRHLEFAEMAARLQADIPRIGEDDAAKYEVVIGERSVDVKNPIKQQGPITSGPAERLEQMSHSRPMTREEARRAFLGEE